MRFFAVLSTNTAAAVKFPENGEVRYTRTMGQAKLIKLESETATGHKHRIVCSTRKVCPHCAAPLFGGIMDGYPYTCLSCSEDFYPIEVD